MGVWDNPEAGMLYIFHSYRASTPFHLGSSTIGYLQENYNTMRNRRSRILAPMLRQVQYLPNVGNGPMPTSPPRQPPSPNKLARVTTIFTLRHRSNSPTCLHHSHILSSNPPTSTSLRRHPKLTLNLITKALRLSIP